MQINQISPGKLVQLRGGAIGRYEGRCAFTSRHRVMTFKRVGRDEWVHPRHVTDGKSEVPTVWLIADDGRCRGDKADSPNDFIGPEA